MGFIDRLADARNTVEGKILAVILSILLVLTMGNLLAFAAAGNSKAEQAAQEQAALEQANEQTAEEAADAAANEAVVEQPAEATEAQPADEPAAEKAEKPASDAAEKAKDEAAPEASPEATSETPEPTSEAAEEETSNDVRINLDTPNAYLIVFLQTVSNPPTDHFDAARGEEIAFGAHANSGFELKSVSAIVDGFATELAAGGDGNYRITPVADMTIKVVTEAMAEEEVEDSSAEAITEDTEVKADEQEATEPEPEAEKADADKAKEEAKADADKAKDKDADKAKEEIEYPAFSGKGYAHNIVVTVEADEGVVPAGAKVVAKTVSSSSVETVIEEAVEAQGKEVASSVAVDVMLVDKDGNEIQPKGAVRVSFSAKRLEGESFDVYHVSDDMGSATQVGASASPDATVETTHFSTYVLVGVLDDVEIIPEGQKLVILNFEDASGANAGTSIRECVWPDDDGQAAHRWTSSDSTEGHFGTFTWTVNDSDLSGYTFEDGYSLKYSSGTIGAGAVSVNGQNVSLDLSGVPEGQNRVIVNLGIDGGTAAYVVATYVQNETDEGYGEPTFELISGDNIKVGDVTAYEPPRLPDQDREGYVYKGFAPQKIIANTGSTPLVVDEHPVVIDGQQLTGTYTVVKGWKNRKAYSLTYDTQGGSYVAGKVGYYGGELAVYSSEDGPRELTCGMQEHRHTDKCYNKKGKLTCDKQEHAHTDACYTTRPASFDPAPTKVGYTFGGWFSDPECTQPAPTSVTLTGDNAKNITVYAKWVPATVSYSVVYQKEELDGSYSYLSSETKTAPVGSTITASGNPTFTNKAYYHVGERTSATVSPDGTTIVYQKYDLNTYYLAFDLSTGSDNTKMTIGGNTYTRTTSPKYTITCKLGEDISAQWPTAGNISGNSTAFYSWKYDGSSTDYVSKRFEVTKDMLTSSTNGSTTTYKAQWKSGTKVVLHYMLQNADNNDYTDAEKYYQEAYTAGGFNPKSIFGFENVRSDSKSEGGITNYYFYYDRNVFKIDYKYGSSTLSTKSNIRFEKNINTSEYNYTPAKPAGMEDYTFGGWYDNVGGLGDPYNFTTMPASNLVLYAKWNAPEYTVTVDLNYDIEGKITTVTIPKGSTLSDVPSPTRDGYVFAGWYKDVAGKNKFDLEQPIMEDTTIYAKWVEMTNVNYTVRHEINRTGEVLAEETLLGDVGVAAQAFSLSASEMPARYADYVSVSGTSQALVLTADETQNVIVFKYRAPQTNYDYYVTYEYNGETVYNENETEMGGAAYTTASDSKFKVWPSAAGQQWAAENGYNFGSVRSQYVTPGSDVVFKLYASESTITYHLNGGTVSGNPATYTVADVAGSKTITINDPTREHYDFLGWSVDGTYTKVDNTAAGGGLSNLFGVGEDAHPYEIGLILANGTKGDLVMTANWQLQKHNVTIHYVYSDDTPAADDYTATLEYGEGFGVDSPSIAGYVPDIQTVSGTMGDEDLEYTVTYVKAITVTTTGGTFPYDGTAHGATVTVTDLPEGFTYEASSDDTATHVADGTVTANCDHLTIYNVQGQDVTASYEGKIKYVDGSITITPKALTVTTPTKSKVYDGTALTAEGTIEGLVPGEEVTFTTTGSQTEVGYSPNSYTLVFDKSAAESDYTVNPSVGTLTVTQSEDEIIVTTTGGSKTYDGTPLAGGVTVSTLPEGYTLGEATTDVSVTNVAEGEKTVTVKTLVIKNAAGEDVTDQLNITKVETATVKINPATLVVNTPTTSKTYDGTALTAEGTVTGFVNNETATFTTTGSQTEVGTSDNTYSLVFDKTAAESNYTVDPHVGTLTVTEYAGEIVVTTTGGSKTYDGTELAATVNVTGLPAGYTKKLATSDDKATHVTPTAIEANCDHLVIENAQGVDVTAKLNIKYVNGTILITPATLHIQTPTDSKVYDGTALVRSGSIVGFVNNETATFKTTGTQTEVGTSDNTYSLDWDGTALQSDYTLDEQIGQLTVTENEDEIIVTTVGGTFTYDGQAHGATVTVSELPEGYTLSTHTSNATATHVTAEAVPATCDTLIILNAQGQDVTSKLNIKYVNGSIKINPAPLTVKTEGAERVYNGEALTASGEVTGLKNNETVVFKVTGSQTEVGESNNTYSLAWDGTALESDYTLSESVGLLKVTEYAGEITVTTTGGTFPYDGTEHGATVTVSELPEGYTLGTHTSNATATHVAEGVVPATCDTLVIKNAAGQDVTSKLNITYVNGSIEITPITLTVTTETKSKVYDGDALTAPGTVEGLIGSETVSFSVTGTQTEVGSSDNTYTLDFDQTAQQDDYTVDPHIGTLTVTQSEDEIVVTTTGGSKTYDGTPLAGGVTVSTLPAGYTLGEATTDVSVTNVAEGEKTVTVKTLVIKNAAGQDVTDQLNITKVETATVKINPATLTVNTSSASKEYDGTALTAPGTITGFVNNETATFTVTGSQTAIGTSDNTYSLVFDKTAVESNYTVDPHVGTLEVTQCEAEIVVTTTGGVFPYDGRPHGATVEVTGLPENYRLETALSNDTATHVAEGAVPANCDVLVIKSRTTGVDVTSSLKITYVNDTIKITPVELTVTTPTKSKVYDGTALTAEGTITGFVNGETATFETTGTQTEVGTSDNTYNLAFDKTAVASDYTVNPSVGALTVEEFDGEIVVTTTGGTFPYDGTAHQATVAVTGLPAVGYTVETATSDDSATHVAEGIVTANCDHLVIKNAAGVDVTSKLNITYVNDTIEITPITLTVTTPSKSKVYDGTALTAPGTITGFVNGETATFATTGTQTAVGSSDNTYTLVFDKTAQEADYTLSKSIGQLTVTEFADEIVVTTTGGTFPYDGTAHGATVSVSTLPTGYELAEATSNATATHVAEGVVTANCDKLVIKNAAGEDVTSELTIRYVPGSIEITPVELTVTTPSASKTYNGEPLTAEGTITGFVNNETATFETTGTQTEVGTSDNTYTLVFDKTAVASDYTVAKSVGQLVVTEYAGQITVTTTGGTFPYDGTEHKATVSVSTLPEGYTLAEASSDDSATHVADGVVTANCDHLVIKNAAGVDVTSKLNISYVNDTIKITPITLTVTTETKSKVYDGDALTAPGTVEGLIGSETVSFSVTGTQTEVGSSNNTYTLDFDQSAQQDDYTVDPHIGTLTVTQSEDEIIVTTTGGSKTYDGTPLAGGVTVSTLPAGYTLGEATTDVSVTHVAEGAKTVTVKTLVIKNAAGQDVTSQLNITKVEEATVEITPAELTVTTPSASKIYNGEPLTAAGSITGFVNNETATFETTGTQTAVGSSDNTYKITWDGTAAETDYTVAKSIGQLVVTEYAGQITVTTTGGTFPYDGIEHKATVSVSTLPEGYTLAEASSDDSATHVAEGVVTANCDHLVIKNAAGEDVTSKLNISYVNDTIEITPATLTVTTPSKSKVYDGDALTAPGSIEGFVNGETATFETTGTQTEVGSSDNTYTLTWDGTAAESDYTLAKSIGKLTVTENADEIVVTTTGGTFPYDGTEHKATVSVSTLPVGYILAEASSDDSATHVADGIVTANCDKLVIKNAAGKDVTSELNIRYVNDTIEITPVALTVTTPSASKTYNGEPLTAAGTITGFVNNETATFETTGTQTEVGSSDNTYKLTWDGTAAESDYTLSKSIGQLVVTEYAGQITVTTTGGTFPYDGTEHKATVSVSTLPEGYTLAEATSDDSATHVAEGVVTANCDKLVIKNAQGVDVTSKLDISYVNDTIEITPVEIAVKTEGKSKVYDGEALTAPGTITGFVNGETATFAVTGTQTEVGSSDNTYTLIWDGTAAESDYTVNPNVGKLIVTENADEIVVTTTGGSKTYDGTPLAGGVTVSTLPAGYTLAKATTNVFVTHVADGKKVVTIDNLSILNAQGQDVTNKLHITRIEEATVEIMPAELNVTTPSASKTYNGEPLTAAGSITGFVNNETAVFETTGTQTEVGSSDNTYKITWSGTATEGDYTVKPNVGQLVVTEYAGEITVTTAGGDKPYDGTPLVGTVEVSTLPAGYTLAEATSNSSATHVAEGAVTVKVGTLIIKNAQGVDVTDKLNIKKVEEATVSITPATLTVKTEGAKRQYNGEWLTASGTITGFVNNETATFTVTGKQKYVGESQNTYTISWDGTAASTDYVIDPNLGKLIVTDGTGPDDPPVIDTDVVKKTHVDKIYMLGETIEFTVTVTNIYDKPMTITLTDNGYTLGESVFTDVATGAVVTTTASKKVTEADLVAGTIHNEVTASFTGGGSWTTTDDADPEPAVPGLVIKKYADKESGVGVGDVIKYTVTATNTGNVTLTNVVVTDELTGDEWTVESLAPNAVETFYGSYTVLDADVITGSVTNKVEATADNPTDDPTPPASYEVTTETKASKPHLTITKTSDASDDPLPKENDVINYTIVVENDGTIAVTDIVLTDELTGKTFQVGTLEVGAKAEYSDSYTVTQADMVKGNVVNTATATGKTNDPDNPEPGVKPGKTDDPVTPAAPHLAITKKASITEGAKAGDIIEYTITATNTGNVDLTNIVVTDELVKLVGDDTWKIDALAVGKAVDRTASYKVTEADIIAKSVKNVATATADNPTDRPTPVDPGTVVTTTEDPVGSLDVVKTTTTEPAKGTAYAPGETIGYKITATNTGNLTVKDITLTDELTGDSWFIDSIAPGNSAEKTASYKVTEEDAIAGSVLNQAVAKGTTDDPTIPDVPGTGTDEEETTFTPGLDVEKYAENGLYTVGDTITYTVTVTNTGDIAVKDITVTDAKTGMSETIAELGAGKTATFKTDYVVSAADVANGSIVNVAAAEGSDPKGNPVKDEDEYTVGSEDPSDPTDPDNPDKPVLYTSGLDVEKYAENGLYTVGDTITYTVTVTNTGNVAVKDITVTDAKTGMSETIAELGAGKTATFKTDYVVSATDVANGSIVNVAAAEGSDPKGNPVKDEDEYTVGSEDPSDPTDPDNPDKPVLYTSGLTVTKTASKVEGAILGETITYTVTATNTGTVEVSNLTVSDTLVKDVAFDKKTLAPGETATVTYTYVITEADVAAGKVGNTATVSGTDPTGKDVTNTDSEDVTVTPGPTPTPTPVPPGPTPAPTPVPPTPTPTPVPPVIIPIIDTLGGAASAIIGEEYTPLAEQIEDADNPMAAGANCWVHFYIIMGIVVTLLYAGGVVLRRSLYRRNLKHFDDDVMGKNADEEAAGSAVPQQLGTQPMMTEGKEA